MSADVCREPQGRPLFSFVVVADTHVNEAEHRSASPYATNAMANGRARYVMHEIATIDPAPAFVVHLGDIVHPVPSLPTYDDAVAQYKAMAERVRVPMHLVPGNHDIGDKSVDWMPADIVCDEYIERYRQAFGADHFAFDAGPVRGLVINTLLLNSGLAGEARQREWLEKELAAAASRRVFLFTHYPPYVHDRDERSTYDNIDQPARAWLLDLIERHRVEALFAGHVHNFWYDLIGDTEFYMLPSTAFLRHDYSEFYRVAPGQEFGRGDVGKFGYCIVDVHESGHVVRMVRTDGRSAAPGEVPRVPQRLRPQSVKLSEVANVGLEMRHPWAEVVEIPSTGGVQEFGRKPARNDYPMLALWEMGARVLKVPDHDVTDDYVGARMPLMRALGHRFVTTTLGLPRPAFLERLRHNPRLVDAIELNLSAQRLERDAARLREIAAATAAPLFWSKLRMHEDARYDGTQFSHFVKAGLLPGELAEAEALLERAKLSESVAGLTVRIDRGVDVLQAGATLQAHFGSGGRRYLAAVKLADASLARTRDDDLDTATLVAETMLAARAHGGLWCFDTFVDIDRGYHPRNGFIDRMFNPRPASRVFAALGATLGSDTVVEIGARRRDARMTAIDFAVDGVAHRLVGGIDARAALDEAETAGAAAVINLLKAERLAGPVSSAGDATPGESGLWLLTDLRRS